MSISILVIGCPVLIVKACDGKEYTLYATPQLVKFETVWSTKRITEHKLQLAAQITKEFCDSVGSKPVDITVIMPADPLGNCQINFINDANTTFNSNLYLDLPSFEYLSFTFPSFRFHENVKEEDIKNIYRL